MPPVEIHIDLNRALRAIDAARREVGAYEADAGVIETLITEAQRLFVAVDGLLGERDRADAFREAVRLIVAEPYGCPMCDSGVLRSDAKRHWEVCPC